MNIDIDSLTVEKIIPLKKESVLASAELRTIF
jgi:hypothetical protein